MIGKYLNVSPKFAKTSFVAPGAQVIGAVELGEYSSIWYNVVARADINVVKIGTYTNIQDGSILHVEDDRGVYIGNHVTIGHGALIHACEIADGVLIGMGAIILNGVKIGKGAKVAAGALVPEGFTVPDGALCMGLPAKITRSLTEDEKGENMYWAQKYAKLSAEYRERGAL